MSSASDLSDPRRFPDPGTVPAFAAALHASAANALAAATRQDADRHDAALMEAIERSVARVDGDALADALASAPSPSIHRHIVRALARAAQATRTDDGRLALTLFAIPIVIVAAASGTSVPATRIRGVVSDVEALRTVLREHRALAGNETFALGNALVTAEAIGVRRVPALLASASLAMQREPLALTPAPLEVTAEERAHLRFLVGSAVAAPGADLLAPAAGSPLLPLARALIAQLSQPGVALVALPRDPASLPAAVSQGLSAQRDVSAQLFASNALRSLRAEAGEPVAVISAHEAADAPGGGELRLSLSSPLAPRSAQGFRCPILPGERVVDVATMLIDLLRDCRVAEVRTLRGIHPDRDPLTGGPLLFKPDTLPPRAVH